MDHLDTPSASCGRRVPAAGPDDRRLVGRRGEALAAAHLERLDYAILARNVRTRHGEIDLIAFDGRTLVFAEVKTRRITGPERTLTVYNAPLASLRPRQRLRLRRLAVAWLSSGGLQAAAGARARAETIRFDALGVVIDATGRLLRLDHLEGAW